MNACILDTETTGFKEPQVIELAYMGPLPWFTSAAPISVRRFRPTKPIDLGARATHHILASDLRDEEIWPGSWSPPPGTEYLVGHNVDFDWRAIGEPAIARICTMHLARHIWPELDSHSLGALTYAFTEPEEARELLRGAHGAGRDVELLCRVLTQILRERPELLTWQDLWALSEVARTPVFMTFGKYGPDSEYAKHNGGPMRCADVRRRDFGYYQWLFDKCDQVREDPYLAKALRGES